MPLRVACLPLGSVLCIPIPPPDHEAYSDTRGRRRRRWRRGSGGGSGGGRDGGVHGGGGGRRRREDPDVDTLDWKLFSSESLIGGHEFAGAEGGGGSGRGSGLGSGWSTAPRPPRPPKQPRPMAVLEVMNKRGGGVFDEHEEIALLRLCAAVECLLRRKAAEVTLMKSGMTLRSCFRNGRSGDTASSNYARVESTIMRLYSESVPSDVIFGDRARGGGSYPAPVGDGDAGGRWLSAPGTSGRCYSGGGDGDNNGGDSWESVGERAKRAGGAGTGVDYGGGGGGEQSSTAAAGVAEGKLRNAMQPLRSIAVEEDSELVDWNLNMFERSAEQQLSLVEQFYRNMGLTERFQV